MRPALLPSPFVGLLQSLPASLVPSPFTPQFHTPIGVRWPPSISVRRDFTHSSARIISLTEGIASRRTFALLRGYQVDENKEMMAIGLMNVVGSCTSCYVSTGAFSHSAVNHNANCKIAMSNIVVELTMMITLLFLMPLFAYTPNVVLASIIISVVIGHVHVPTAFQIWKLDKINFFVCLSSFVGVIFLSVQEGLTIAVGLSIFRILL